MPATKRLKHKKQFEELFNTGNSIRTDGIVLIYKSVEGADFNGTRTAFSVSKRKFKRAVDRNRLKRLMREAWRLNYLPVEILLKEHNLALTLVFVYIFNEPIEFTAVQEKVKKLLDELNGRLNLKIKS